MAARAEQLAKGWLVAVIEERSLAEAPAVARAGWAEEAPRVCAAAVRALGSDGALQGIARPSGELGGSIHALRAVLWSALRSAWPDAEPDQVWDLGERLAVVIESLSAGTPAWPSALEEAIARAGSGGTRLALLLAEPVDADRLLALEPEPECAAVLSRFREAVRRGAGPDTAVVEDGATRVWVLGPGADRERAVELGEEIARQVGSAPPWRGAPLETSVGIAVLGEDGEDAGELIDAAEQAMFAAAAAGIEIERRPR